MAAERWRLGVRVAPKAPCGSGLENEGGERGATPPSISTDVIARRAGYPVGVLLTDCDGHATLRHLPRLAGLRNACQPSPSESRQIVWGFGRSRPGHTTARLVQVPCLALPLVTRPVSVAYEHTRPRSMPQPRASAAAEADTCPLATSPQRRREYIGNQPAHPPNPLIGLPIMCATRVRGAKRNRCWRQSEERHTSCKASTLSPRARGPITLARTRGR